MLSFAPNIRIFLHVQPTDMRKSVIARDKHH